MVFTESEWQYVERTKPRPRFRVSNAKHARLLHGSIHSARCRPSDGNVISDQILSSITTGTICSRLGSVIQGRLIRGRANDGIGRDGPRLRSRAGAMRRLLADFSSLEDTQFGKRAASCSPRALMGEKDCRKTTRRHQCFISWYPCYKAASSIRGLCPVF